MLGEKRKPLAACLNYLSARDGKIEAVCPDIAAVKILPMATEVTTSSISASSELGIFSAACCESSICRENRLKIFPSFSL